MAINVHEGVTQCCLSLPTLSPSPTAVEKSECSCLGRGQEIKVWMVVGSQGGLRREQWGSCTNRPAAMEAENSDGERDL